MPERLFRHFLWRTSHIQDTPPASPPKIKSRPVTSDCAIFWAIHDNSADDFQKAPKPRLHLKFALFGLFMFTLAHPLQYWSPIIWALINFIALGIILAALSVTIHRRDFHDSTRVNLWLWLSFSLICLWLIKGQVMDHLYFHLVGASVAFLLLGMPLALLALACTTLVTCITLQTSPWIWGMQFILAAVLPLMIIALLHHLVKRTLPHRLFVYIFIRGFFVAAIGMMLAMFINLSLIGQVFGFIPLAGNPIVWASPILLGWGEGFLSGAAIALIATYNPEWLYRHAPFKGM